MLVTPEIDRHNRRHALMVSAVVAVVGGASGWFYPPLLVALAFAPVGYWLLRHRCLRRMAVARRPFPPVVASRPRTPGPVLPCAGRRRRRSGSGRWSACSWTRSGSPECGLRWMTRSGCWSPPVRSSRCSGSRTGTTTGWAKFSSIRGRSIADTRTEQAVDANILGLTGLGHLRGVVILSKPSLLAGFADTPGQGERWGSRVRPPGGTRRGGGRSAAGSPARGRAAVGRVRRPRTRSPVEPARRDQRLRLHQRARVLRRPLRVLLRIAGDAQGEGLPPSTICSASCSTRTRLP